MGLPPVKLPPGIPLLLSSLQMLLDGFQCIQDWIPFLPVATGTRQLAANAHHKCELSSRQVAGCLNARCSAGASFPSTECE